MLKTVQTSNGLVIEALTSDVVSVYSGRPNKCCCGCSGKHSYNPIHQALGSKRRGYAVNDDELSARMVNKVLHLLQAYPELVSFDSYPSGSLATAVINGRLYIAYFV